MIELSPNNQNHPAAALHVAESASLWRNRSFLLVFTSYSLSLLGNTFHSIALNLWVLQTTGSAKLMSAVLITHLVVSMLFGSLAGTIADRANRRMLMWGSDLVRFVLVGLIALLIYLPGTSYTLIIVLTGLVALVGTFRTPAFQASLVEIVGKEQLTKAVGAIGISDNIVRITGFALGGAAVALLGGAIAIAIDAAAFLVSAVLLLGAGKFRYEVVKDPSKPKASFKEDFIDGFRYVWQNRFAKTAVVILPVIMLFFLSTFMLVQVMAVQVWKADAVVFGLIEACIPLGYVIGSILIMKFDKRIRMRGRWIVGSIVPMGPLFITIAFISDAYSALPFILIIGFLFSFSTTIIFIALRVAISPELQGRVFGLLGTLTSLAPPAGLAIFSALSDLYGPAAVITASGILLLLISCFMLTRMRTLSA